MTVGASTIHRRVRKSGPEIHKRAGGAHRSLRGFRAPAGAKAALAGIETFRAIRKGQYENCEIGVTNEIHFVAKLFPEAV
ncbi:hypothetical protein [uncultured Roseibium sp.]|uniref:hypothetical protein n=1 Tax=uncultured Roseibium sp. TaxID=1936171 RepID=UPI003217803B